MPEIGIRIALGAGEAAIIRAVVGEMFVVVLAGLATGLASADSSVRSVRGIAVRSD
jgi:hypothetical protein